MAKRSSGSAKRPLVSGLGLHPPDGGVGKGGNGSDTSTGLPVIDQSGLGELDADRFAAEADAVGVRHAGQHGSAADTQITIQAGQTYDLPALLTSSTTVVAAGGNTTNSGAVLQVAAGSTSAEHGAIVLEGGEAGSSTGASGATLLNDGILSNVGPIKLEGGQAGTGGAGGQGATLINAGTLTSSGYMFVFGGYGAPKGEARGLGALLSNTGVLTNTGTLSLGAGPGYGNGGAATLLDSGVLTNSGEFDVSSESNGGYVTVQTSGVLSNAGTIEVGGVDNETVGNAVLSMDGVLDNSGLVDLYSEFYSVYFTGTGGQTGAILSDAGVLTNSGNVFIAGAFITADLIAPASTLLVSGILNNQGQLSLGFGNYYSQSGQMTVTATGTLLNSGTLGGSGDLTNLGVVAGDGTVPDTISVAALINDGTVYSGASMQISGDISADAGSAGQIEISNGGTLALNGAVASSQTLSFQDAPGEAASGRLDLATPSNFAALIDGFSAGDTLDLTGLAYMAGHMSDSIAGGVFTVSDGQQTDSFTLAGVPDGTQFSLHPDGGASDGTLIEEAAQCYARGTRLRTERGDIAVEQLAIGDRLVTLHGGLKPIKWIGHRSYEGRFIAGNHLMLPVCIKADALAPNVPLRDVSVSPGHGVYVDGALVPAWRLVNGVTITQETSVDRVSYVHVELAEHEIVFADGLLAETYLDEGCRSQFTNAGEFGLLYSRETAGPRPTQCVPRIEDGFQLYAIQQRLSARASIAPSRGSIPGALRGYLEVAGPDKLVGWALDEADPEQPVCLDVVVDGRRIQRLLANRYRADVRAVGFGSGCHGFDLHLASAIHSRIELCRSSDGAVLERVAEGDGGRAELDRPRVISGLGGL